MEFTKGITKILIAAFSLCAPANSFAQNGEDFESSYYEETKETGLSFKVRGYGLISDSKQSGLPTPTAANPAKVPSLIKNGYGADTAAVIFATDKIAAELSLGLMLLNTKSSTLSALSLNYGGTAPAKKKNIYAVPLTGTLQYHFAPYGGIDPYIGVGGHASYLISKSNQYRVKNSFGAVLQIGADFIAKDDTFINFDIRQYFMKTKVTYKGAFVNNATNVTSKLKINPLVVSVGLGFRF